MFLDIPFRHIIGIQNTVLIINTVLLLGVLITIELIYSEKSRNKVKELSYIFPFILAFIGILIYAIIKQVGVS